MKSEHGGWPFPCSNFFKNQLTKLLGFSLGVAKHGPRGMTMHQKLMCQNNNSEKKSSLTILSFSTSFPPIFYFNFIITTFLYQLEHKFCLSHCKSRWTMLVDNVDLQTCLLGTLNFMVTLTFLPWCKPKWSRNVFNNQSHILQGLGTTSWSMV
jgi:hypothetical protein